MRVPKEHILKRAEQLDQLSDSEIFALLDLAYQGRSMGLDSDSSIDQGDTERGRSRFKKLMNSARERICESKRLRSVFSDPVRYGRAEVAAIVLDTVFQSLPGGVALAAALVVARHSWDELCSQFGDQ